MTDHLPECRYYPKQSIVGDVGCICDRLRACEQRVRASVAFSANVREAAEGWANGVQAARDAVAAMVAVDEGAAGSDYLFGAKDALALIDNLITKNSGENYG